ncbi:retrovirus-related pol polyprotein from transposon TNT 1-94 [Tanacetum coccineum]
MDNPKDISDPTTAMNMTLIFMAKTFKLNYTTPTKNNQRISPNPHNFQIAQLGVNMGQERQMQMVGGNGQKQGIQNVSNQNGFIVVPAIRNQNGNIVAAWIEQNGNGSNTNQIRCYNYRGVGHYARNCIIRPRRRDYAYLQNQLLIAQIKEVGLQLNQKEYDLIIVFVDYEEEEKLHVNCILMANLQQASTSGTHADTALVYDSTKDSNMDLSGEMTSVSNTVSKPILIPDDESLDDTPTKIIALKFLNEVKDTIVTLERVVKSKMLINDSNWSSHIHQEIQKVFKDKIASIVDKIKVRVILFEEEYLKEAATFVRDYKSLAKEADESLERIKCLEQKNDRLLRSVVSQDIMSIMQAHSVTDTSNLQTELDRAKEKLKHVSSKKKINRNLQANSFQTLLLFLVGYQDFFMVRRLGLFQAYDGESEAAHQLRLEVYGNYLEVAFSRNICFVKNLDGVNLLKENHSINLYTINLHEITSSSPICLLTRATSTKSWLWHQRLSHLNFDTINKLAKDNIVKGLPKFKYTKDHLCPSLRVKNINGKQYILVIMDDYSRYTWVHFLISKDEAPGTIIKFLKQIQGSFYPKNDRGDIRKLGDKDFTVVENLDVYIDHRMGESKKDEKDGVKYPYEKLQGFYKGYLSLGPGFIRDEETVKRITRKHERILKKRKPKTNKTKQGMEKTKSSQSLKVIHMKKIQLGGLKIAKSQVVLQELKDKGQIRKLGEVLQRSYKS